MADTWEFCWERFEKAREEMRRFIKCPKCRGRGHNEIECPNEYVVTDEEVREIEAYLRRKRKERAEKKRVKHAKPKREVIEVYPEEEGELLEFEEELERETASSLEKETEGVEEKKLEETLAKEEEDKEDMPESEEAEEIIYANNEGEALVVQRILLSHDKGHDEEQRSQLFHTQCTIERKGHQIPYGSGIMNKKKKVGETIKLLMLNRVAEHMAREGPHQLRAIAFQEGGNDAGASRSFSTTNLIPSVLKRRVRTLEAYGRSWKGLMVFWKFFEDSSLKNEEAMLERGVLRVGNGGKWTYKFALK